MKVVLLNPPPKNIVELRYDLPDYPSIGLGYVAAYSEKKGIDITVIDAKLARLSLNDALKQLVELKPDIIGLTAMTHEIVRAAEAAGEIKKVLPNTIIGIGGIHASVLPRETLQEFQSFDVLFCGEGELTFYEFVCAAANKKEWDRIKGLGFRKDNEIVINPPRDRVKDLDTLPPPAWHLFPGAKEYHIITGRGCPFSCIFCTRPHGQLVRKRSPELVVSEIEGIVERYKPERFLFCDETFTIDKKYTNKVIDLIVEKRIEQKVHWYVQTHVNTVDVDILSRMKKAGCSSVGFGIESGNPAILKQAQKGITLTMATKAVDACKKVGLFVEGFFIIGHPNETYETIWDTIKFAAELNPDRAIFGIMVPYPNTVVWEMAKKGEGGYKIISARWSDFNKQIGNALEFQHLSRKKLELLQLYAYMYVFIRNMRFGDLIKFCYQYKHEGWTVFKKIWGLQV